MTRANGLLLSGTRLSIDRGGLSTVIMES